MRRELIKAVKSLVSPLPSFFDLSVMASVFGILWLPKEHQGIYLVFFSAYLCSLTLMLKPNREWKSTGLSLFVIWSFLSLFKHSWMVNTSSVVYKWINFSLMSEGFIYILFGAFLLKNIVNYSRNIKLLYLLLPIAMIPWIKVMLFHGQVSPILGLAIAFIIYLIMKKEYLVAILLTLPVIIGCCIKHEWIAMKWACRPYVWIELLRQMQEHPFVGSGFNKFLTPDNLTWIRQIGAVVYGWIYRHNDYLSIAAFIGTPVLLTIGLFITEVFNRLKKNWLVVPFMAIVIMCFFQITMFSSEKAFLLITGTALLIWDT
jgi:hypothetical protein